MARQAKPKPAELDKQQLQKQIKKEILKHQKTNTKITQAQLAEKFQITRYAVKTIVSKLNELSQSSEKEKPVVIKVKEKLTKKEQLQNLCELEEEISAYLKAKLKFSQKELAEKYQVSRHTVRESIESMQKQKHPKIKKSKKVEKEAPKQVEPQKKTPQRSSAQERKDLELLIKQVAEQEQIEAQKKREQAEEKQKAEAAKRLKAQQLEEKKNKPPVLKSNGQVDGRSQSKPKIYKQLKLDVSLIGSDPLIRRVIQISANKTLENLHEVIQVVFEGWQNCHMHEFQDDKGNRYQSKINVDLTESMMEEKGKTKDESKVKISQLLKQPQDEIGYVYDMSCDWVHRIEFLEEVIMGNSTKASVPKCVLAERAAPPEDVQGIEGYYDYFLKGYKDPEDPEGLREWYKERYGNKKFNEFRVDLKSINDELERMCRKYVWIKLGPNQRPEDYL